MTRGRGDVGCLEGFPPNRRRSDGNIAIGREPVGEIGMQDYRRLDDFLAQLASDVYPEPPSEPHLSITKSMVDRLAEIGVLQPQSRVLDIGCGQGLALRAMAAHGVRALGITLGPDVEICRASGLDVQAMDQSFLEFPDASFDVLWCRHVLEHSIFPLYTLHEWRRVLRPGGYLYCEVPAPETAAQHHTNKNHYSIFSDTVWTELFTRSKLMVAWKEKVNFSIPSGTDTYLLYLLAATA